MAKEKKTKKATKKSRMRVSVAKLAHRSGVRKVVNKKKNVCEFC